MPFGWPGICLIYLGICSVKLDGCNFLNQSLLLFCY